MVDFTVWFLVVVVVFVFVVVALASYMLDVLLVVARVGIVVLDRLCWDGRMCT